MAFFNQNFKLVGKIGLLAEIGKRIEIAECLKTAQVTPVAPDMTMTALAPEAAERYGMGGGRPAS